MKRLLIYSAIILSAFAFCSCGDDDENLYYVKYTFSANTIHLNVEKTIKCSTPEGEKTIDCRDKVWEETYGPVSKSFKPRMECVMDKSEVGYGRPMYAKIYVSRNNEPFVLKAEGTDVSEIKLSCKIDV